MGRHVQVILQLMAANWLMYWTSARCLKNWFALQTEPRECLTPKPCCATQPSLAHARVQGLQAVLCIPGSSPFHTCLLCATSQYNRGSRKGYRLRPRTRKLESMRCMSPMILRTCRYYLMYLLQSPRKGENIDPFHTKKTPESLVLEWKWIHWALFIGWSQQMGKAPKFQCRGPF